MNVIRFKKLAYREGHYSGGIRIFIDGRDLTSLIRKVELPFARAERHPSIAGSYAGLPPEDVVPPSKHFLGKPRPWYKYGGRTQVLMCNCGEPGCWPLACRIGVRKRTVVWADFLQPHRSKRSALVKWGYSGLVLRFDRKQYEMALRQLASAG